MLTLVWLERKQGKIIYKKNWSVCIQLYITSNYHSFFYDLLIYRLGKIVVAGKHVDTSHTDTQRKEHLTCCVKPHLLMYHWNKFSKYVTCKIIALVNHTYIDKEIVKSSKPIHWWKHQWHKSFYLTLDNVNVNLLIETELDNTSVILLNVTK